MRVVKPVRSVEVSVHARSLECIVLVGLPRHRSRPESSAWLPLAPAHLGGYCRRNARTSESISCSTGFALRFVVLLFMACPCAQFEPLKCGYINRLRRFYSYFQNTTFDNTSQREQVTNV
jgi:hypothetical protein